MMAHPEQTETLHGLMAEFDNPTDLVAAADRARSAGYTAMDAYSPFPIEELNDALGLAKNPLPLIILLGGIFGGLGGYFLEYWTQVMAWPMNIGGRPFHSWPHFIPVTFECAVLGASLFPLHRGDRSKVRSPCHGIVSEGSASGGGIRS